MALRKRNTFIGKGRDDKDAKAEVRGRNDFDEYEVWFYDLVGTRWQRRHSATHFTDDLDDAIGTAQDMVSGPPADWREAVGVSMDHGHA